MQALLAIGALAARTAGADRDAVALGDGRDVRCNFVDDPGNLMAEHHRFLDADRAESTVVEVVQVRAADAAFAHAHTDLAGCYAFSDDGLDPKVLGCVDDEGFHGRFLGKMKMSRLTKVAMRRRFGPGLTTWRSRRHRHTGYGH